MSRDYLVTVEGPGRPTVFRVPSDREVLIGAGAEVDIAGGPRQARLHPEGGEAWLEALDGAFRVDGRQARSVSVDTGIRAELASGVTLVVRPFATSRRPAPVAPPPQRETTDQPVRAPMPGEDELARLSRIQDRAVRGSWAGSAVLHLGILVAAFSLTDGTVVPEPRPIEQLRADRFAAFVYRPSPPPKPKVLPTAAKADRDAAPAPRASKTARPRRASRDPAKAAGRGSAKGRPGGRAGGRRAAGGPGSGTRGLGSTLLGNPGGGAPVGGGREPAGGAGFGGRAGGGGDGPASSVAGVGGGAGPGGRVGRGREGGKRGSVASPPTLEEERLIRDTFGKYRPQYEHCDDRRRLRHEPKVRVVARFLIGRGGRVENLRLTPEPAGGASRALLGCLRKKMSAWRFFDPGRERAVVVKYPFRFT